QIDDRVERVAGRLAPQALPELFADGLQGHFECEDLGDRLDGEADAGIAGGNEFARAGIDGDPEPFEIRLARLGPAPFLGLGDRLPVDAGRRLAHLFDYLVEDRLQCVRIL